MVTMIADTFDKHNNEDTSALTGLAGGGTLAAMLCWPWPCIPPPAMGTLCPAGGPRVSMALGSRPETRTPVMVVAQGRTRRLRGP